MGLRIGVKALVQPGEEIPSAMDVVAVPVAQEPVQGHFKIVLDNGAVELFPNGSPDRLKLFQLGLQFFVNLRGAIGNLNENCKDGMGAYAMYPLLFEGYKNVAAGYMDLCGSAGKA